MVELPIRLSGLKNPSLQCILPQSSYDSVVGPLQGKSKWIILLRKQSSDAQKTYGIVCQASRSVSNHVLHVEIPDRPVITWNLSVPLTESTWREDCVCKVTLLPTVNEIFSSIEGIVHFTQDKSNPADLDELSLAWWIHSQCIDLLVKEGTWVTLIEGAVFQVISERSFHEKSLQRD
jgi:hypothetical protein